MVGFIFVRVVFKFISLRLTILIFASRVHIIKPKSINPKMETAEMINTQIYEYLSEKGEFGGETGVGGGFDTLVKDGRVGTN